MGRRSARWRPSQAGSPASCCRSRGSHRSSRSTPTHCTAGRNTISNPRCFSVGKATYRMLALADHPLACCSGCSCGSVLNLFRHIALNHHDSTQTACFIAFLLPCSAKKVWVMHACRLPTQAKQHSTADATGGAPGVLELTSTRSVCPCGPASHSVCWDMHAVPLCAPTSLHVMLAALSAQ